MHKELRDFEQSMKESLSAYSESLIMKIRDLKSKTIHPDVQRFDCEVFQYGPALSIRAFLMDDDLNEVFNSEDQNFTDSSIELIAEAKYYQSEGHLSKLYDTYDREIDELYIYTVVNWFSDCIDKSKGKLQLPIFIQRHDSSWTFDLQDKDWVQLY